jgi:hypothetical protein
MRNGLQHLSRAYAYAEDAGTDSWGFALQIDELYELGLTINDLRWLVAKGFAVHGSETSQATDQHRSIQPSDGLAFGPSTCVVLTDAGASVVNDILNSTQPVPHENITNGSSAPQPDTSSEIHVLPTQPPPTRPEWDATRRTLFLGTTPVKRFRVPAKNQEIILSVFQEEGWPSHIDDPLPVSPHIDPRTRLHDTINRLNRSQTHACVRFRGNGHGNGVLWELQTPAPRANISMPLHTDGTSADA